MQSSRPIEIWLTALLGLALSAHRATSQVVLSPIAVVGNDLGSASDTTSVTNLINQSGVTTPFVSGVTVFDTYFANPGQVFATSGNGGIYNWQSAVSFTLPLKGTVDFDLGATYRINKIAIWNRSIKNVTVKVLNDLSGPEQIAGSYTLISRLSFSFSYAVDVLSFATNHQGRYVRLAIDSVHTFSPSDTFGYAIIGEVVASATPVGSTPLPPTIGISHQPNGDVIVTFTGTLQTATNVLGAFGDVPGNPPSPNTILKGSLSGQQFFRARN